MQAWESYIVGVESGRIVTGRLIKQSVARWRAMEANPLLYFDELQEFPDIATALKFFRIDGRFDVICSGSMLGTNCHTIQSDSADYQFTGMLDSDSSKVLSSSSKLTLEPLSSVFLKVE